MQSGAFPAKSPIKEYFPGASGKFRAVVNKDNLAPKKISRLKDEDYVKNLQHQIYLLELETRYLRSNKLQESKDTETNFASLKKTHENEVKAYKESLNECESKLEAKEFEIQSLKEQLTQKEADQVTWKEYLKNELTQKETLIASKSSDCVRLEQFNQRQKQIQESLELQLTTLQEELYQSQTQFQLAQSKEKQFLQMQQEHQKTLLQLKDAIKAHETLESQYQTTLSKLRTSEHEQTSLTCELRQLKLTQQVKDQLHSKLEAELKAALLDNTQLVQNLTKAETSMHEALKETSMYQLKLKENEHHYETLLHEKNHYIESIELQFKDQKDLLNQAQKQLASQHILSLQSKEAYASLKIAHQNEVDQVDALTKQLAQLQSELKFKQKSIQELELGLNQAQLEVNKYTDLYQSVSKELKVLNKKNVTFNKIFEMVKAFETTGQGYLKEMHQALNDM